MGHWFLSGHHGTAATPATSPQNPRLFNGVNQEFSLVNSVHPRCLLYLLCVSAFVFSCRRGGQDAPRQDGIADPGVDRPARGRL